MAEEEKNNTQEEVSPEELEKLNQDLDASRKKLVSEETEEKIKTAKEEAKKEAEKEFIVNQKIKELEEDKKKLEEDQKKREENTAKELDVMKEKLNQAISSKAVSTGTNPFEGSQKTSSSSIDQLSDAEIDAIERASFEAFENRRKEY